jgi:rhombotail lipoprotein
MKMQLHKVLPFSLLFILFLVTGCAGQQSRTKSSVVDYLYPNISETIIVPSIPILNLPVKVGIAFVPEQSSSTKGMNVWAGYMRSGALTEANKADLLERVADHFRKYEFVSDIEVIPSAYLTPGGSFPNLEQISTMYGIDIVALVSYDQVQFTDEGMLSLTYWTLVGAYVFAGEKNDTSTMLDTAVYDIHSRKMLFRAPGTSVVKGSATPINLSEELRADSIKSYKEAADNMTENLDVQLNGFRQKIKKNPEQVKIVHREGSSYGGATGLFELTMMMLVVILRLTGRSKA